MTVEECAEIHHNNYREHETAYLSTDYQEVWDKTRKKKIGDVGRIAITVDQAHKILSVLTPAQKRKLKNG